MLALALLQAVVPAAPIDTTALASKADVAAVAATVTQTPCGIPAADTLRGSAGSGTPCVPRPDASRPTVIQSTTVTTAADGTFSGNWPAPFASAPTGRLADVDVTATTSAPYKCSFLAGGVTAMTFAGKCWQIVATTLPSAATAVMGFVVSPLAPATGGLTVRVTGRQ